MRFVFAVLAAGGAAAGNAAEPPTACAGVVYLTLDTGTMRHAHEIASILSTHKVQASFFLANEATARGDNALDDGWADYWRARVNEGHAFGSHTWRHGRFANDQSDGAVRYRPMFGDGAGKWLNLSPNEVCSELRRVDQRFLQLTGRNLDALWRAPGGYTTPHALGAAQQCGLSHVHWAPAGFLGDELPSDRFPNQLLLQRALRDLRDGDVIMAHLGIHSRQHAFAPMLAPLIEGLRSRGLCFRTLIDHPAYQAYHHGSPGTVGNGPPPAQLPVTRSMRALGAERK